MIKKSGTEIIKNVKLSFYPLTIDRWKDFEQLFGERGEQYVTSRR